MENNLTRLLAGKLQEKFDGNASELARVIGTSQQNISNWLNGDVIRPGYWKHGLRSLGITEYEFNEAVELDRPKKAGMTLPHKRPTRVAPDQYHEFVDTNNLFGDQPANSRPSPNATVGPRQAVVTTNKMLPVLGMAVGGEDGRYVFNGSIIDYVVCPPSLENVAGAYAVYIDGESMYPRFKPGETAWVHPGKPARRGDDVIVQIHPPEDDGSPPWGYVKELKGWAGNKLILTQHNPQIDIEFDRQEVMTIHPIVLSGKY